MKLQSIQILRGIAALLVVVYHVRAMEILAIGNNGLSELPLLNSFVTNGYAGVDLFFVISGFIMVYVTDGIRSGVKSSAEFLFARVTRIYPLWWVFAGLISLMFIIYNAISFESGWDRVSQGQPLVPYLIKSFLLVPQNAHPVLGVGWTLIHEMYFYAAFTLMMLVPRRFWLWILLAWGTVIAGGSFVSLTKPFASGYSALVFYPMTMEFIMGAVVGLAVSSGIAWRSGILTLVATLWLAASLTFQGADDASLMMWGRVVWFGLPCTLLVYGFTTLELSNRQAWLVPAFSGAIAACLISLLYNVFADSTVADRFGAAIMSAVVGAIAMMVVLWSGWLGGQAMPERVHAVAPPMQGVYRGLTRVGDWSFSLYLCHPLLFAPVRLVFAPLGKVDALAPIFRVGHPGPLDNIAFYTVSLAAALLAAALAYRFIERPMIIGFGKLRERLFYARSATVTAE